MKKAIARRIDEMRNSNLRKEILEFLINTNKIYVSGINGEEEIRIKDMDWKEAERAYIIAEIRKEAYLASKEILDS